MKNETKQKNNCNVSQLLNKPSNVFTPSSKNFLAAAGLKSGPKRCRLLQEAQTVNLHSNLRKFLPPSGVATELVTQCI